ncbi:MAG: 30S ribosomal protein S12 methylthiotransferase RimO [Elusimicrobia bacterium]|nr:30S ribosomal protein S12 methylthiotransferase RimO [Elusimicrobiota bacterium]
MRNIYIISFGCPKNLVDSETIAGILAKKGYTFIQNSNLADVIIINTCAFIDSARKEAYTAISGISESKQPWQKLIVCGCLPQLEKKTLLKPYPGIDAILGSSDFNIIPNIIDKLNSTGRPINKITTPKFIISDEPKIFSTPRSYAYIKIADGCNNKCNYCLIPRLRGHFRSRNIEYIIKDIQNAVNTGRKEIILVAQDTTLYGIDIYGSPALSLLLKNISGIKGLKWIRILYTHPAHFTDELISVIAENSKLCKYIDIPIQHTDDIILKKMGRPYSKIIFDTIEKLRKKIHGITLRTTIMVGFPDETEKNFKKLLNDIKALEFDWLGGFVYSPQTGTKAFNMHNSVSQKTKNTRLAEIMKTQQKITLKKNEKRVGKTFDILADSEKLGHTEFQAPEIDGKILFSKKHLPGEILKTPILAVKKIYDLVSS